MVHRPGRTIRGVALYILHRRQGRCFDPHGRDGESRHSVRDYGQTCVGSHANSGLDRHVSAASNHRPTANACRSTSPLRRTEEALSRDRQRSPLISLVAPTGVERRRTGSAPHGTVPGGLYIRLLDHRRAINPHEIQSGWCLSALSNIRLRIELLPDSIRRGSRSGRPNRLTNQPRQFVHGRNATQSIFNPESTEGM